MFICFGKAFDFIFFHSKGLDNPVAVMVSWRWLTCRHFFLSAPRKFTRPPADFPHGDNRPGKHAEREGTDFPVLVKYDTP
jgi:hypothetical protein